MGISEEKPDKFDNLKANPEDLKKGSAPTIWET